MYDVAIVGAGPVGLFLAAELALADCSVLVLEKDHEPASPFKALPLGMRGLNAGSVETFYRRGMLTELLNASGADAQQVGAHPDAHHSPAPATSVTSPASVSTRPTSPPPPSPSGCPARPWNPS